ncbi:MAG: hypothetical protein CML05_18280 [Pseudozobellia sp.]|nr:hypothetical protein [Pseudozobellia sp.]|tara:strand:+ start:36886 stop:38157 length:1272 start_codon:yes stop_codon:yes gene_type:complete
MPKRPNSIFEVFLERLFYFILILSPTIAASQEIEDEKKAPMRLYINCNCDKNFLRQEIKYVGHVRDQAQANITLFIFDIANGSGGRTFNLEFKGLGDYEAIASKLTYDTSTNMTSDEIRKGMLKKVQSGLLPYVLTSGLAEDVTYTVNQSGMAEVQEIDFTDPWNNWIFEVFGSADLGKESSRKDFKYRLGFQSDHVTDNWRIRTDVGLFQSNSEYETDGVLYTSERFRYNADGSIVRSISDHWSTGIFSGLRHDTFTNLDFKYYVQPAIEYNIYPYKEVLRREIVFAYKIGYFHNDYIETTIFNKLTEGIYDHSLDMQVRYRQQWGNIYAHIRGSSFLSDFTKNRLQLNSNVNVRLVKGLAVRFASRYEIIRDQINLPGGDASIEDVLLQQKQIATDYELGFSVGLSYTFGSAFNNVINTRL